MLVVIVEDDPGVGKYQAMALEQAGIDVRLPDPGPELMHPSVWAGVDVAVVDVMMPKIDGREILRWLAQHCPNVRRVCVTALSRNHAHELRALAHVVVLKPFRPSEFVAAVRD